MTEKEFAELLRKNPQLRISQAGSKQHTLQNPSSIDKAIQEEIKTQKYGNQKVYVFSDGFVSKTKSQQDKHGQITFVFDSTKEYVRWTELQMLEKAGKIINLRRQEVWLIQEAFSYQGTHIRAITYRADFAYETPKSNTIVEDVKPFDEKTGKYRTTEGFSLKWKLLKARYPTVTFTLY